MGAPLLKACVFVACVRAAPGSFWRAGGVLGAAACAHAGTRTRARAPTDRLDDGPLVAGCGCFTCRNHTRAYLHHLVHAHEMLASVLLEMHNTHWWLGFFEALREAVREQRLGAYAEWFAGAAAVRRRRGAAHVQAAAP